MNHKAEPTVVAPVMRFVSVTNLDRSLHFDRDVLGFQQCECNDEYSVGAAAELELGAARLQLLQRRARVLDKLRSS